MKNGRSLPQALSRSFDKKRLDLLWTMKATSLNVDSCNITSGILGGVLHVHNQFVRVLYIRN